MSLSWRGLLFGIALLLLGWLAAGTAPSSAQPAREPAADGTFKALTRSAIEELGRDEGEKPPGLDTNNTLQLTNGLNRLAESGWTVIAIEPAHTQPITGPKGSTVTRPPTYIFKKL